MKKRVRQVLLSVFAACMLLHPLESAAAMARRRIISYENEVGLYYGKDLTLKEIDNPIQFEEENKEETIQEEDLEEAETEETSFEVGFKEEERAEKLEDEGFSYVGSIDENTTIYQSEEDPNLKQVIFTSSVTNFEFDGSFYPIETKLEEAPALFGIEQETGWQNLTNTICSFYPRHLEEGILLSKGEVYLTIHPLFISETEGKVQDDQILYSMKNGISLRYQVKKGQIQEEIILMEKPESSHFEIELEIENGKIEESEAQPILIKDEGGEVQMMITAPKASDASGNETEVLLSYHEGILEVKIDEAWLNSEERVYPIVIDPDYLGYSHHGVDISVCLNQPNRTIGNPDMAALNWNLPTDRYDEAYMYLGNHPTYGESYSFYQWLPSQVTSVLSGKYIKDAAIVMNQQTVSKDNTINVYKINGTYDIKSATYANFPTSQLTLISTEPIKTSGYRHEIDVTEYVKGIVEKGEKNNGVLLALEDNSGYAVFYASEHYYVDGGVGSHTPSTKATYYDSPDVTMSKLNDFTFQLRPFVKSNYEEGLTFFVALGFDGIAPMGSTIEAKLTSGGKTILSQQCEAADNFFRYPDYPKIEGAQEYKTISSNWQTNQFIQDLESGKLYELTFQAKKGSQSSTIKKTSFQIVDVKSFDVLIGIADFYGVDVETLKRDNNMQDELITEGNKLFVREPKKNQGVAYPSEELSDDVKKQIDAALRGRGVQCEFGFEPINLNTGSFLLEAKDTSFNVLTETISLNRTYNSTGAMNLGALGYGWSFISEIQCSKGEKGVTIRLEDGKKYFFEKQADGSYTNELTKTWQLASQGSDLVLRSNEETLTFNEKGQLISKKDHEGRIQKFTYTQGKLSQIEFEELKRIRFEYDGMFIKKMILPDGKAVQVQIDSNHDLVKVIDPSGAFTTYQYDDDHNLISWNDQNGQTIVKNTYDENHRVIKQIDALGNEVTLEYQADRTITKDAKGNTETIYQDPFGQTRKVEQADGVKEEKQFEKGLLVSATQENGVSFSYEYDENGNLIQSTRSDGFITNYTYDKRNNLLSIKNSAGQSITYRYDEKNHLISETDSLGNTTTYTYNSKGQKTSKTDALGNITRYEYDASGNQTKQIFADGSGQSYTYNAMGFLTMITDDKGNQTKIILNERNEKIREIHADGGIVSYEWDKAGKLISFTNELGGKTSYQYDGNGNLIKMIDALGSETSYQYDANGNKIQEIAPNGKITSWTYDERDRMISETISGQTTSYTYNESGVETITNPQGQVKKNVYDELGRIVEIIDFDGLSLTYSYDLLGNLIEEIDKKGNKTTYIYDLNNQLIQQKTERSTLLFTMDANGQILSTTEIRNDGERTGSNEYNETGKLIKNMNALGNVTEYIYEGNDLVEMIDALGNQTITTYDSMGRMIQETYADGSFRKFAYDKMGNVILKQDANGTITRFTYNQRGDLIEMIDALGHVTKYEVDAMGRTTKITSPMGITQEFTYDGEGRILSESLSGKEIKRYEYDQNGDLIRQIINGVITTYRYDAYHDLIEVKEASGLSTQYRYDEFHRLILEEINGTTFRKLAYNSFDEVCDETDRYGEKTIFEIDPSGRVASKTEKGLKTTYHHDLLDRVIEEEDSLGNTKKFTYDALGHVIQTEINGSVSIREYDLFGNMTKQTDSLGRETIYTYDKEGNLIKTVDANGTSIELIYDETYHVIEKKIDDETILRFVYDADGRVIQQINGEGGIAQTIYDKYNQVIRTIDERGYDRTYRYDERGNLIEVKDEAGDLIRFTYNNLNQLVSQQDQENHLTQYRYDIFGNPIQIIQANGGVIQNEYNELNQLIKTIDVLGNETSYRYNSFNLPVSIQVNGKQIVASSYDEIGREIEVIDGNGNKSFKKYDSQNNLIETIDALGGTIRYEYDSENQVIRMINEKGIETEYLYDGIGQLIEEIIDQKRITQTEYDGRGNVIATIDSLGNITRVEYDLNDRLIKMIDPCGNETSYVYNETGQLIQQIDANGNTQQWIVDEKGTCIQRIDPKGNRVTMTVDKTGQITSVQDEKGYRVNYTLDSMGNLIKMSTEDKELLYSYDLKGQITSIKDANGKIEKYEYDEFGNVIRLIQKDGHVLSYSYDGNQNLIQKQEIQYVYDAKDRLVKMIDENGVSTFRYDERDHLITMTRNGQTVSYTYNDLDEKESVTYPDGSIQTFHYDLNGNLIQSEANGILTEFEVDELGRVIKESQSNGLVSTKSYDGVGNITSLKTELNKEVLNEVRYAYDQRNSLIQEERDQLGQISIIEHEYNERDELIKTIIKTDEKEQVTEYRYSITGNKIQVEDGEVIKSYEYNEADQLTKFSDESYHYTYQMDEKGNRIQETRSDGAIKSYEYDEFNQLIRVIDFDKTEIHYTYDGLGVKDSQTIYTEDQTVQQKDMSRSIDSLITKLEIVESHPELFDHPEGQNKEWEKINIGTEACAIWSYLEKPGKDTVEHSKEAEEGSEPIKKPTQPSKEGDRTIYIQDYTQQNTVLLSKIDFKEETNYYYDGQRSHSTDVIYLYDGLGNVTVILSLEMKLMESLEYSDYGERKNSIAKKTEFGYNGEEHTIDGMQDLRARVYDPKTGVFLQQDSFGGNIDAPLSQNQTLYCLNNPLKYADPSGHKAMLNQDLGGSKINTPSSKTTIRPSGPSASRVSVASNKVILPTVNTSRGWTTQPTTSVPVSPTKSAEKEKADLLKQKSEIIQSLQSAQSATSNSILSRKQLNQARLSESVSSLNAVEPDVEGSLYDRAQGNCQSSKQNERPYYYDNPFGVEPIDVYYSGNEQRIMPLPDLADVMDIYVSIGGELTASNKRIDLSKFSMYFTPKLSEEMIEFCTNKNVSLPPIVDVTTNMKMLSESFSLFNSVMIGINFANSYAKGVNEKEMSNEEALIYGGVMVTSSYAGSVIGASGALFVSSFMGFTGLIPIIAGVAASYIFSGWFKDIADELYDIYAPKVKEAIEKGKQFVVNKWNEFTDWAGNLFKF